MNGEGYTDKTADKAVNRMARKEKRRMGKTEDKKIHDKATKIRKKTDVELVNYVEDRVAKARAEGYNAAKKEAVAPAAPAFDFEKLLDDISHVQGVGYSLTGRIRNMMIDKEYIHE